MSSPGLNDLFILIGYQYNHGHLARAVSGRVTDDLADALPPGYQSNYPYIGRVSKYDVRLMTGDPHVLSIDWSLGDDKLEILNGGRGICDAMYVSS